MYEVKGFSQLRNDSVPFLNIKIGRQFLNSIYTTTKRIENLNNLRLFKYQNMWCQICVTMSCMFPLFNI